MNNKPLVQTLYEQYQSEPGVRLFIEAISAYHAFPIGAVIETFVGTHVNNMIASRMKNFYDELNNGDIELNETLIENDSFLHSYFSVVNYVARSKSDEKATRFARIIKGLYNGTISIDQFEDYISIFNELSDREFAILVIKMKYESVGSPNTALINSEPLNPYQRTLQYWEKFVNEINTKLNIDEKELGAFLFRLQRSGCYIIHTGYLDTDDDGKGDTTVIFKKLFEIIKE